MPYKNDYVFLQSRKFQQIKVTRLIKLEPSKLKIILPFEKQTLKNRSFIGLNILLNLYFIKNRQNSGSSEADDVSEGALVLKSEAPGD